MSKFRSHWLALFGGVTLIALSMSSAFAGKPDGTNPGLQVSAYVHSLVGDVEETDTETETEDETETETEDETEVEVEDSASSDHGECVREVAKDHEAVGGDNENHGGAVSEAARVTCQDEGSTEEANTEEQTEDEADSEVESDEDGDSESEAESEDAAESNGGSDHGKGHGHDD